MEVILGGYLIIVFIAAIIMGFIGVYVSRSKNRSGWEGFLFGFFLSILGIIIAALLPTIKKEKPAELKEENMPMVNYSILATYSAESKI